MFIKIDMQHQDPSSSAPDLWAYPTPLSPNIRGKEEEGEQKKRINDGLLGGGGLPEGGGEGTGWWTSEVWDAQGSICRDVDQL